MATTEKLPALFHWVMGEVEDALLVVDELEGRIGGSCEMSSVRTDLNRALTTLTTIKQEVVGERDS